MTFSVAGYVEIENNEICLSTIFRYIDEKLPSFAFFYKTLADDKNLFTCKRCQQFTRDFLCVDWNILFYSSHNPLYLFIIFLLLCVLIRTYVHTKRYNERRVFYSWQRKFECFCCALLFTIFTCNLLNCNLVT